MSYNPSNVSKCINDLEAKYGKCSGLSDFLRSMENKYSIKNTQNVINVMPSIQSESVEKNKVEAKPVFTIEPKLVSISRSVQRPTTISPRMILDIKDQSTWQEYMDKVRDVSKIESFFNAPYVKSICGIKLTKLKEKYGSNYHIKIKQYLNEVNKIKEPDDFDGDTNLDIAVKIGDLVRKYFMVGLLKSAHNGMSNNVSTNMGSETEFCYAYEAVLDKYLDSIKCGKLIASLDVPRIRFHTNIKYDNSLSEYFEALNPNKDSKIMEIFTYPRVIYYIDADGKTENHKIQGQVMLF